MTTLTAPLPLAFDAEAAHELGGLTLEQRLGGAWQELHGHGTAACPVCGDRMDLAAGAGHCRGCGSRLG